ncbi:MAG: zinc-ribbon domain-containing protein [Deltaproteobacteria bacterium]|nr:zinc-ribbon domain-containing protein [Deltaproteobacteria bacterium]
MVVECNKCSTRFQLDSSKIPDSGIRVRCSRCKHAFFLQHPSQSQASAVESVVEQAIEREGSVTPNSSEDLAAAAGSDSPGMGADQDASNDPGFSEDEDDWEFNEDLPSFEEADEGDDQDEEVEEVDQVENIEVEGFDDDDESEDDEADDFDLDGGDEAEESDETDDRGDFGASYDQSDSGAPEFGVGLDDYSSAAGGQDPEESGSIDLAHNEPIGSSEEIGSVGLDSGVMSADDLTSSSMSIDSAPPAAVADEAASVGQGLSDAREDAFGSVEDFSAPTQEELPGQGVPLVGADDATSEDPENWDFLGDQATPSPQPLQAAASRAVDPARAHARPEHDELASGSLDFEGDRQLGAVTRIGSALAWVAFFGLLSSGVYLGVMGSIASSVSTPAFVSIGEMRAANIRGRWLDTTRAGTLYVVTGDLVNPGTEAMAPSHAVQVSLLGEGGRELGVMPAFAGRDVQLDSLREMSVDELWSSQRLTALALAGGQIGPGQSASFAATFIALPREASHFILSGVAPERINQAAVALGVPIPVAPVVSPVVSPADVATNPDGLDLVGDAPGGEVAEPEIAADPQTELDE